MNIDDKLEGMLLKCSGGVDGRVGLGSGSLVVMTIGERGLANHPLLAEDDEDDDEDLTGGSLVSHNLIPPDELMVQEETVKNNREEGGHFPQRFLHKMPCTVHMPVSQGSHIVKVQRQNDGHVYTVSTKMSPYL